MPSEEYYDCVMGPLQVSFLCQSWASHWFKCLMLMFVMVFTLCFPVPMWSSCSQMEAEPLGFVTPQCFRLYPWQAHVPPSDGLWPMPGVYIVAAFPTTSSRDFMLLIQMGPSHSINPSSFPTWVGRDLLFQIVFHPMTSSTPNLWWALNS